jgi:hypothetical protein
MVFNPMCRLPFDDFYLNAATATIMLAWADASFDGVHFCLPGPIQEWSKMLFYRISKNNEVERRRKNEEGL